LNDFWIEVVVMVMLFFWRNKIQMTKNLPTLLIEIKKEASYLEDNRQSHLRLQTPRRREAHRHQPHHQDLNLRGKEPWR